MNPEFPADTGRIIEAMAKGMARSKRVGVLWSVSLVRKAYIADAKAALAGLIRAGYEIRPVRNDGPEGGS